MTEHDRRPLGLLAGVSLSGVSLAGVLLAGLLLASNLSGCTLFDAARSAPWAVGALPGTVPGPAAQDRAQAEALLGELRIRVKWPTRDLPNFKAQVIPLRTRSIRLVTKDSAGKVVDQRLLGRQVGVAEASASIDLAEGMGYSILAEAFAQGDPDTQAEPIALATAANVPIRKGKITQVPITLTAAYAPAISGLEPGSGQIGSLVTIAGTKFGASVGFEFLVTFAGVHADATRSSDTAIVAIVPIGPSGNVVVTVDGVPSTSVAPFAKTDGLLSTLLESIDVFEHTGLLVAVEPGPTPSPAVADGSNIAVTLE